MKRIKPRVGDVIEVALPDGRRAYGRVLREASVAFYRMRTESPNEPPIGSRDYEFIVGVYKDVIERLPVVGHDPTRDPEDEWPPPGVVRDPITEKPKLYHKGAMAPATEDEVRGLEPVAAWDLNHVVDRLMGSPEWT